MGFPGLGAFWQQLDTRQTAESARVLHGSHPAPSPARSPIIFMTGLMLPRRRAPLMLPSEGSSPEALRKPGAQSGLGGWALVEALASLTRVHWLTEGLPPKLPTAPAPAGLCARAPDPPAAPTFHGRRPKAPPACHPCWASTAAGTGPLPGRQGRRRGGRGQGGWQGMVTSWGRPRREPREARGLQGSGARGHTFLLCTPAQGVPHPDCCTLGGGLGQRQHEEQQGFPRAAWVLATSCRKPPPGAVSLSHREPSARS